MLHIKRRSAVDNRNPRTAPPCSPAQTASAGETAEPQGCQTEMQVEESRQRDLSLYSLQTQHSESQGSCLAPAGEVPVREGQHSVHSRNALETVAALVAHGDLHSKHRVGPCPGCSGRKVLIRKASLKCQHTLAGCAGDECRSASDH